MECHEGATMIKTFRGQITNDGQEEIVLHTNNGSVGYRIIKFQVLPSNPEGATTESLITVWSTLTARDGQVGVGTINFAAQELLAVVYWSSSSAGATNPEDSTVIFDTALFNQDIYLTCKSSGSMNYYIELEQFKLDLNENTVATLKNIRNLEPGQI